MSSPGPEPRPTRLPVLIVGSGLSGLTLAHALSTHQIPYRIFERDSATDERTQGYRVGIDACGASALHSALGGTPGLFEEFEKSCGDSYPPAGSVDAVSGEVLGTGTGALFRAGGWGMLGELAIKWVGGKTRAWTGWMGSFVYTSTPQSEVVSVPRTILNRYPADRRILRSLLLRAQTPHITHSASFTSYTLSADGKSVLAHFADGSSVAGSLLVGADGANSLVARQLIGPGAVPKDMGGRIIYGKTPISLSLEEEVLPALRKGTGFVVEPQREGGPGFMVVDFMRLRTSPMAAGDYVFWALAGKTELFDAAEKQVKAELGEEAVVSAAEVAVKYTEAWHPSIRTIIQHQAPETTAAVRMTTSPMVPTVWQTNRRVALLGDAVHCMPPAGGQGANMALHDAALLGLVLGSAKDEGVDGWSVGTIRKYEDGMRANLGGVVGLACIGAKRLFGVTIPGQ